MRAGRRSRVAPSRVTLSVHSLRDAGKGTRVSSTRVKTSSSFILVRAGRPSRVIQAALDCR
ncbi:hypothetical protein DY000_02031269 [Brassica cretica]|uniref:Uncharacterized protein n=1 Tax=Brassica cretica TaxID=69181 RepID=A0ABQ7DV61_BRACR|nr:hypothetical protein DY000_02031269 [Brassica cretica]